MDNPIVIKISYSNSMKQYFISFELNPLILLKDIAVQNKVATAMCGVHLYVYNFKNTRNSSDHGLTY